MKMAPTHFTNHMKYAQQNSKKQKWHNAAYWGSFQNDRKITGNMKKKIQEMKMAPTHFTMHHIGAVFKMTFDNGGK